MHSVIVGSLPLVELVDLFHHRIKVTWLIQARVLRVDDLAILVDQVAPPVGEDLPLVERSIFGSRGAIPVTQQVEGYLKLLAELRVARPAIKTDAEDLGVSILEVLVVVPVPGKLALSNGREVSRVEHQNDVLRTLVVLEGDGHLILRLHPEIRSGLPHIKAVLFG